MKKLIDKLTIDIFNQCVQHLENDENKTKLQDHIIDPIIVYLSEQITIRIYSYFMFLNIILILITLLLMITLVLLIRK